MGQTRIVVNPKIEPLAKEILEVTKIANLSDLFSLLVSRYGTHLKSTWVLDYFVPAPTMTERLGEQQSLMQEVEEFPPEDPVIVRLAGMLEKF
jgi:hypothetical protein